MPEKVLEDPIASLRDKFRIENHSKEWHLFCLKCPKAFALKRSDTVAVGNVLALLNHAASHTEKRGKDE